MNVSMKGVGDFALGRGRGKALRPTVMKTIALAAVLAVLCDRAFSEWSYVAAPDDGSAKYYMDKASVERSGPLVKAWELIDYFDPVVVDGKNVSSAAATKEYNCHQRSARIVATLVFDGRMGAGNIVGHAQLPGAEWAYIVPGSLDDGIMKIACALPARK